MEGKLFYSSILIYITLPTKVHLVKAMVFLVVMYGCESWTIKKAECVELMLLNCGVGTDMVLNARGVISFQVLE